jgi:subtilisin-like proprotein convertase family protein
MHLTLHRSLRGLVLPAALALASTTSAQSVLSRADGSTQPGVATVYTGGPIATQSVGGAVTITQSASQAIVTGGSVSCNAGGLHTDNSYLRVFDLATHGITTDFTITSVESGVEQSTGATGSQPIEWKFYVLTDPAGPVTRANFTPLGTVATTVPDLALALHQTAITGVTAAPANSKLVVELFTPNGQTAGNSFFVGANPDGQTGPTYLEAATCGVTTPTPTGSIGFPNMHWVLNVTGETGGSGGPCTPGPTTFCSTDTPLAIPDNNPAGVTSTITVAAEGSLIIDDLDVGMGATHSWAGDMIATVTHGATSVVVYDRPGVPASTFGCSGDNPVLTMDDEGTGGTVEGSCTNTSTAYPPGVNYTPNNPLSAFDGVDATGTWTMNVSDNALGDTGSLDFWSLLVTPGGGGGTVNTYTANPNAAIPDNNPTGITSTITVPPSSNIVLDVDVQLTTTHSWAGDLAATLTHGAASSTFYDRPGVPTSTFGCSGDNPTLTVDDEGTGGAVETSCTNTTVAYPPGVNYTPNNPLTVFDMLDVEGDWVLTISDNALGDTGTLNSWSIIVTEDVDTASPGGPGAAVASLRALPNPMNASGTIELSVPTSQHVRVAIYDMLGREVMVVFDREISASQRALIGIGADRLDSGVYVVRATGEDFSLTQRVTVTR